jgi:signal peptidase I
VTDPPQQPAPAEPPQGVVVDDADVAPVEPGAAPPKHRRGRRKAKKKDGVRSAVEWAAVVVGALVVALVVKTFLFQAFYIPSGSMEPTLKKGDRVLVNKLSYDLHDVHRGDIIVFRLPKDKVGPDGIRDLIKRVIGLPGDVIESRNGLVYIDGKRLKEPYLPKGVLTDNPPVVKQRVPKGKVFVMGDNRNNSADSRFASRGPIAINTIIGRAFVEVWPPSDVGGL